MDLAADAGDTQTTYTYRGLSAGQRVHYRVSTLNAAGRLGPASSAVWATLGSIDVNEDGAVDDDDAVILYDAYACPAVFLALPFFRSLWFSSRVERMKRNDRYYQEMLERAGLAAIAPPPVWGRVPWWPR